MTLFTVEKKKTCLFFFYKRLKEFYKRRTKTQSVYSHPYYNMEKEKTPQSEKYFRLLSRLKSAVISQMQCVQGSDERYKLFKSQNQLVFKLLQKLGFFTFYPRNRGFVINRSQVIAFLNFGYKALLNGFTTEDAQVEVHHLNGNVWDDRPENLEYLSKADHCIVSNCTNTPLVGRPLTSPVGTPFNKQGKLIKDSKHHLANIIQATLKATSSVRGGFVNVSVVQIFNDLPKRLYTKHIQSLMPRWMSATILKALHTAKRTLCLNPSYSSSSFYTHD